MADPIPETRREYTVLKEWDVQDTIRPYYGTHAVGDVVFVHEDVAAPLVEDGTLELIVKDDEAPEEPAADAPTEEAAPEADPPADAPAAE